MSKSEKRYKKSGSAVPSRGYYCDENIDAFDTECIKIRL